MAFSFFRVFVYAAISTLLLTRIIFFILNVDLGSTDGQDDLRTFFCASLSFIFISRIYLFFMRSNYKLYKKIKIPLDVLSVTLIVVTLFMMISFRLMQNDFFSDAHSPLEWLKIFFWTG